MSAPSGSGPGAAAFYIGKIGEQQAKIIAKRDPAARPVLEGAGEVTAPAPAAPREQAGSGLRERLAHVRELNEGHPLPAPPGALPVVPGVPPEVAAGLVRVLASGSALGRGGRAGPGHVQVRRAPATSPHCVEAGVVEKARGGGRSAGWQLTGQDADRRRPSTPRSRQLAQAVHDGLVPDASDEQREVLEQVWQIAHRPRLTLLQGSGGRGQ